MTPPPTTPTPKLERLNMGELKPDVDLQALNEWFADIPPGPYDALNTTGGWEVRQIDTDPANKHHWPFRLCSSITGQTAGCDAAVFSFIAGVINAWPHLLDADRTEGRGDEPVAWRVKDFADGWILFHTEAGARREAEGAGNLVQPLYASPIREPEISREALIKLLADHFGFRPYEQMAEDKSDLRGKIRDGYDYDINEPTRSDLAEAADAILNLAPVGGRGEEGSSQSQPGVNAVPLPASPDGPSQMDRVWAAVNVLGAPDTACTSDEDRAYCRAIGDALSEIEKLGGRPQ